MSNSRNVAMWTVISALLAAAIPLLAQLPTGTIQGTVKDPTGASVVGATVTIQNNETGQVRTTTSNEAGAYRVPALPVGRYTVKIEKDGFRNVTHPDLTLDVTQEQVINTTLEVGAAAQEVTVTGQLSEVNTTNSTLASLIGEQKISELPLNGRNFIDLSLMQTGVSLHANTSNPGGARGVYLSTNGGTLRSNSFLLDGASMVNAYGTGSASVAKTTLGVEGIREYKVVTSTASAEYGMTMGSHMIIVSKGGTNQWHGSLFEYHRNSALDAANYFDKPVAANGFRRLPAFKRNNFGGSIGGPIQKDKTFFFFVYEGLREQLGTTNVNQVINPNCLGAQGATITNTACPELGTTPSVIIGSASPAVVPFIQLLSQFPPNLPGNQFTYPFTQQTRQDYSQLRLDHNISESDSFFARYTIDHTRLVEPAGAYPLFHNEAHSKNQWGTLSETHIFSPTLVGTGRFSYSRTDVPTNTVFSELASQPQFQVMAGQPIGAVTPGPGLAGFSSDPSNPTRAAQNIFTGSYDMFASRGNHSLKFGTLVNHYQASIRSSFQSRGGITFNNIGNFLRGVPQNITGIAPGSIQQKNPSFESFGFYGQDDIRVLPRLTLNVGLRYEFLTEVQDREGRGTAMVDITRDATTRVGKATFRNNTKRNFSPRLGFAWDVFGNGQTSVRGGGAYMYDLASFMPAILQTAIGSVPFAGLFNLANAPSFTIPVTIPSTLPFGFSPRLADYNWTSSRMLQYNLTLERQMPWGIALTTGYVGSRGWHLPALADGNPAAPLGGAIAPFNVGRGPGGIGRGFVENGLGCDGAAAGPKGRKDGDVCWGPATSTCTNVFPQSCRVNPNFANIQLTTASMLSWYNALQVGVRKQLANGLQFQSSYTWSKLLDTTQGQINGDSSAGSGFTVDPNNPRIDRGPAQFNLDHNWRFNLLYHLPSVGSNHKAAKFLQGWWMGTIVSWQSGYPFSPVVNANRSRSGVNGGGGGIDRPDFVTADNLAAAQVGDPAAEIFDQNRVITGNINQWFNPHMFTLGPVGYLGNTGRNFLRGPTLQTVDLSFNKDTRLGFLGEQGNAQFRVETFNLLNRPNFAMPNRTAFAGALNVASQAPQSNAGLITSTATQSRQIQVALRISF